MAAADDRAETRLNVPPLDQPTRTAVRSTLADLPGVDEVRFDPGSDVIVVVVDPRVVSDDELLAAIGENGIEARPA